MRDLCSNVFEKDLSLFSFSKTQVVLDGELNLVLYTLGFLIVAVFSNKHHFVPFDLIIFSIRKRKGPFCTIEKLCSQLHWVPSIIITQVSLMFISHLPTFGYKNCAFHNCALIFPYSVTPMPHSPKHIYSDITVVSLCSI